MDTILELFYANTEVVLFGVLFSLAMLVALYAIAMIYHRLRVIEGEIQAMRKDETVLSQEMEILAQARGTKLPGKPGTGS